MTRINDIRILIVDDHMVVRKGLVHVLDTILGMTVIAEAESGEEAIFLCQKLKPDMVIMDVKMEGMGGIEAIRLIAQHHPLIRILGLSTFASQEVVSQVLSAGAHGYLLKDVSAQTLAKSIQLIQSGETLPLPDLYISPNNATSPYAKGELNEPIVKMGEQQKKVLALMSKGFTNPDIAAHLNISLPTARYHVSAILQKLDVSNRAEAVAFAIRTNLVDENN